MNPKALEALTKGQRQLDQNGDEVGVSRQALDELIAGYQRLQKLCVPEWFYPGDNTESDSCCESVSEAIQRHMEYGDDKPGRFVMHVSCARRLPDIYALVTVYSDDEKDARNDDEDFTYLEFPSSDEAKAALATAQQTEGR